MNWQLLALSGLEASHFIVVSVNYPLPCVGLKPLWLMSLSLFSLELGFGEIKLTVTAYSVAISHLVVKKAEELTLFQNL